MDDVPAPPRAVARCGGLRGSPDESAAKRRENRLSKSGNARVRRGMIQLAWRFLHFQKDSALAQWFRSRVESAKGANKRTMIVAKCSSTSAATRYGITVERRACSWSSSGVDRQCDGQRTLVSPQPQPHTQIGKASL
jgi:hypothetical protein